MNFSWICSEGEQIQTTLHTYTIIRFLGAGSFGQVFSALINGSNEVVALKCGVLDTGILNSYKQEITVGNLLQNQFDTYPENLIKILDYRQDATRWIIIYELCTNTVLDLICFTQFRGISLELIQHILRSVFFGLSALHKLEILHADLSPENIMLNSQKQVKIIDFGACLSNRNTLQCYIQSRYYRAPEVVLEIQELYSFGIDIWSLGCVAAECCLGVPIFASVDQANHLQLIELRIGKFPRWIVDHSCVSQRYFQDYNVIKDGEIIDQCHLKYGSLELNVREHLYREDQNVVMAFIDLLKKMLQIDPRNRISLDEIKVHPFLTMSL